MKLSVITPTTVSLMIKPVGALCNLDCTYCYYLPTKTVYDGHEHRMSLETLEAIFAGYLPHAGDHVTINWQGGEPTLAGLSFFQKAIELQKKHSRTGQQVHNALQTNATLINEDWAKFLHDEQFLLGVSVDGPAHIHDRYRVTNQGKPSHDMVMQGLEHLKRNNVEVNLLCVLNQANVTRPAEVYRYLLNLGVRWLQFIPEIVFEKDTVTGEQKLADHCPTPLDYGKFMAHVFDDWFANHRERVSVRLFDTTLGSLVDGRAGMCILDSNCSGQLTIEHNGDVYGCDHFVERRWQLAHIGNPTWTNDTLISGEQGVGLTIHGGDYQRDESHSGRDILDANDLDQAVHATSTLETGTMDTTWFDRLELDRLSHFSSRKQDLPDKCLSCDFKAHCHGGCPEHRPHGGDMTEASILCEGYLHYFHHVMPRMKWMADYLKRGLRIPPPVQYQQASEQRNVKLSQSSRPRRSGKIKPNEPCPCGSGMKYKKCCGKVANR